MTSWDKEYQLTEIKRDRQKEEFLESIGILVIRFQDSDIYPDNRDALAEIERYIHNRNEED